MSNARRNSRSSSATPAIGTLATLALALSVVGLVLGAIVLFIHQQLAASQGDYTSFCTVSEGVSCDVVLGSAFASFLGIPVGGWALLSYVAMGALAAYAMRAPAEKRLPVATLLLALTGATLGISVYFFLVSTISIGVLCPMCLAMDAVNIALFASAVVLYRLTATPEARRDFSPNGILGLGAGGTVVALAALVFSQSAGPSGPVTVESIRRDDPRFYAFYISQPIIDISAGAPDPATGSAPITIVEFSDYQCPYCRRAYLDLARVAGESPGDIRVVHRNFPLNADCNPNVESRNHAVACVAAYASECADRQGKGSALSHLFFVNQSRLSEEEIRRLAAEAGLDMDRFDTCVDSPDVAAAVAKDIADGMAAGVESTPTLFINGRRIKGGFSRPEQYRYALAIERSRLDPAPDERGAP